MSSPLPSWATGKDPATAPTTQGRSYSDSGVAEGSAGHPPTGNQTCSYVTSFDTRTVLS